MPYGSCESDWVKNKFNIDQLEVNFKREFLCSIQAYMNGTKCVLSYMYPACICCM